MTRPEKLRVEQMFAAHRVEAACRRAMLTPDQVVQARLKLHFHGEEEALRYIEEHALKLESLCKRG